MRIVLVNKFYHPRGGDCVYTISLQKALEEAGHEVAIFAMDSSENLPTPWSKYFPSEVSFQIRKPLSLLKSIARPIFSIEVKNKFQKLLEEFSPDVVHLNNIHSQIGPIVGVLAKKKGVRVIWTLHDYKLLCPRYDCLKGGIPCELCFTGSKRNVLFHKCMKNSLLASFIAFVESKIWNRKRVSNFTNIFICPSQFIKEKMLQGGFNANQLIQLCNAVPSIQYSPTERLNNYFCYVGRISEEKGLRTLLRTAAQLNFPLKILGTGPLEAVLRNQYKDHGHIQFLGHQNRNQVIEIVAGSRFMIIPSEWYENNPLTILESHSVGTPVLGANIGGIPELILSTENGGRLFKSGDAQNMRSEIINMWNSNERPIPKNNKLDSMMRYMSSIIPHYQGNS